jgi:hypothetical protein
VGILLLDKAKLRLHSGSGGEFPDDLPPVIKDTIARLDQLIADAVEESEKEKATRALAHLYRLLQNENTGTAQSASVVARRGI